MHFSMRLTASFAITLFLIHKIAALGNYENCCEIQKCKKITESCLQSSTLVKESSCSEACLQKALPCFPGKGITFPPDYTCFGPFLNSSGQFNPISSIVCDQSYAPHLAPAPDFFIDYGTCKRDCSGWQLSKGNTPSQWAGALTAYILPAVIFCMTIPRWQKWDVPDQFFHFERSRVSDVPFIAFFQTFGHALVALIVPGVIVIVDMTIWVFTIFILAGPMMVGGIYEGFIDLKILSIMQDLPTRDDVTEGEEAKRLGDNNNNHSPERGAANGIDGRSIDADGRSVDADGRSVDADGRSANGEERYDTRGISQVELLENESTSLTSAEKIELLLAVLAGNLAIDVGNPKAYLEDAFERGHLPRDTWLENSHIRLRSMLHSQYSFGSMIGAPVLFYIGSFGYSIAFLSTNLGDNDTAHGLAFGMWWMAIVHVAIISGCLLASNNPSTATAIVAGGLARHNTGEEGAEHGDKSKSSQQSPAQEPLSPREMFLQPENRPVIRRKPVAGQNSPVLENSEPQRSILKSPKDDSAIELKVLESKLNKSVEERVNRVYITTDSKLEMKQPSSSARRVSKSLHSEKTPEMFNFLGMSPVYESTPFLPVSIWDRGRVKRSWIEETAAWKLNTWFQKQVELSAIGFSVIPIISFLLILLPSSLAFFVAYTTPRVCVSCRSFTILLYTSAQIILIVARAMYIFASQTRSAPVHEQLYRAQTTSIVTSSRRNMSSFQKKLTSFLEKLTVFLPTLIPSRPSRKWLLILYVIPVLIAFLASFTTSFLGTFFEILGVYRNCRCKIPIGSWLTKNVDSEWMNLATDTEEARYNSRFWSGTGYAALAFMIVVTYFGWWYQRYLRKRFDSLVDGLVEKQHPHYHR